ncbi:DUF5009 domain-containing protein [uncultured Bacteroides sp.]|uniref:DUF5009 domain-containing protein n=1 Tax=uncultured Bacteroides sp. TaxID=162156 RepID=UPI002AA8D6DB|nr:DUF5009 domain-containing protein [uncultured Bacteroides sp.]
MKTLSVQRVAAVDVFRALTMFLMLFVNDIPGLRNIPHWLHHAEFNEDMLGFSDTIFPAFLFIMGMSISFAIQNRLRKGDSLLQVIAHIFWRTLALVAMGVFSVNSEGYDSVAAGFPHYWFSILMVTAFFLIWAVYPRTRSRKKYLFLAMKVLGIGILLFLFLIYKGENGTSFGPRWWGILGLIGWTYFVCAAVYLVIRENVLYCFVAWGLFILLSLANHAGVLPLSFIPSDMTLHAFGLSGVLVSLLMQKYADRESPQKFILLLCGLGAVMFVAAVISHPFWIISKIQATPSWFFYCTAIFFPLFGLFYWLTDVKGKAGWFNIIKPAGTATLTCYLVPYLWYNLQELLHIDYPEVLGSGIPGLLKSVVYSLAVVGITWLLVKNKIKLKI